MKKILVVLAMAFALVACNTEEKKLVKEHETEIRNDSVQIDFEKFEEVKRIGDKEAFVYTDGKLYYNSEELSLDEMLENINFDEDSFHIEGEEIGSIYRATFTVEREGDDVDAVLDKYYFIDDESNVIIPITN